MDEESLTLYPNPANDFINASFTGISGKVGITVYNMQGAIVRHSELLDPVSERIDLSGLPAGIFLLEVRTPEGNITKKIVVE